LEELLRPETMYSLTNEFLEHFDTTSEKWAITSEETLRKVLQTQETINPATITKNLSSPVFFIDEEFRTILYLPELYKEIPPAYVIVQQDGSFGILVSNDNPNNLKISINELPSKLKSVVNNRRLIRIVSEGEKDDAVPITLRRRRNAISL
jgi:hypothetical protein